DRCPQMVLRVGIVVSDSGRRTDGCFAVSAYVPCKAEARRKLHPVAVPAALPLKSRISGKSEAQRCFLKHRAPHTRGTRSFAVFRYPSERQCFGKVGLPPQAVIYRPTLIHFPAVGCIEP